MKIDLIGFIIYFVLAICLEIILYFFTNGLRDYKKYHVCLFVIYGILFFIYKLNMGYI
ncbi:MAG: hypothetical protein SStaTSB_41880 [Shewanella algae]